MKKWIGLGIVCLLALAGSAQQQKPGSQKLLPQVDAILQKAAEQYQYFASQIPDTLFPKSLKKDGSLETSKSWWWCSGFYPGTLLYLCTNRWNDSLYNEAQRKLATLEREKFNTGTHDLGFMMYCSFGNNNLLKPSDKNKEILLQSARSLASRFSPVTGCIRSWNAKKPDEFLVIIDNMMNLELLTYATKVTGDSSFYKIAVTHANTTMKNHFRPDYSSFHVVEYSEKTGAVTKRRTQQGANDSSAWSRGQGWALYGYTLMYRETGDQKYLALANHIANYILNHPNLPADKIPYWDFNAPTLPNAPRDASAGALIASALLELSTYNKGPQATTLFNASEQMLTALASKKYLSPYGENKGFLLEHSVGSLPQNSEVDVPLTYADYYFVEGLLRYKALSNGKSFNDLVSSK